MDILRGVPQWARLDSGRGWLWALSTLPPSHLPLQSGLHSRDTDDLRVQGALASLDLIDLMLFLPWTLLSEMTSLSVTSTRRVFDFSKPQFSCLLKVIVRNR